MAGSDDEVSLGTGKVIQWSPKALCVRLDDLGTDHWIPRSVITDSSEVFEETGDNSVGEVFVQAWFARKEGLV